MSESIFACSRWVVMALVIAFVVLPAIAQTYPATQVPSRILSPVDDSVRSTIPSSTHPLALAANDVGPLEKSTPLQRMIVVLGATPAQEHQARTLLDSQQTKGSPNYHHWLTPEEFGQKFGPSQQDIAQVTGWLQQHGFAIGSVAKSGRWVEFSGTSAQVEAAFQTQMRQYLVEGELHFANAANVSIPAALAPVVRGVLSLNNFFGMPATRPAETMHSVTLDRGGPNSTTSNGSHFITPGDLATIYDLNPLYNGTTPVNTIDGSGQVIAIAAGSNINLSDVSAFQSLFGLPQNPPNIILNGSDPGVDPFIPSGSSATALVVEYAGAVAPGATIDLVVTGPSDGQTLATFTEALSSILVVDQNLAPVVIVDFDVCEQTVTQLPPGPQFWSALWEQAAAQGISVIVLSGGTGAAGCDSGGGLLFAQGGLAINGIASTPFNTAVGGTEFNETGNGGVASTFWSSTNGPNLASALG